GGRRLRHCPSRRRPAVDAYDRGARRVTPERGTSMTDDARRPAEEARRTVLDARDVSKAYGPTPALRGATVTIASGEIVAVTGASGSGKSTLLHCLAGIVAPDAGEVRYRDRPLGRLSERERSRLRRTDFGILFQFGHLVAELTAAENVALPLL